MSLLRNTSQSHLPAPPPSPVPTAKGSRSAANDTLSAYLDTSLTVPGLSLPYPHLPLDDHIPERIDLRSLESRDYDTIVRLLRSAREFGAFAVTCHGFCRDDLQSLVGDADRIFRDLEKADTGFCRNSSDWSLSKEQIGWVRSGKGRMKCARDDFVGKRYGDFSEKMEDLGSKLDAFAELLGEIFVENIARMQFGKRIQGKESVLSLYRYNPNCYKIRNPSPPNEKNSKTCDHTFCLHLPATPSRFFIRSAAGLLSFDAGLDTVVVIVGHRIEEWSMGDFKCVCEEVICEPHFRGSQASFSIELKCLSLNFDPSSNKNCDTITIRDQILIVLLIVFLYKIFVFLFS